MLLPSINHTDNNQNSKDMYKKKILSLIAIVVFAILAGASFDESDGIILIVSLFAMALIGGIAAIVQNNKKEKEELEKTEKKKKEEEYRLALAEQKAIEKEKKYNELTAMISSPDKVIEYDYDHYIMVNESTSQIMLNEHIYNFKDIINYTMSDNATVIQKHSGGEISSTSSTDTGSMLGRAVVGGVLAGGVGAAIGGSTAKRETTSSVAPTTTTSSTIHDYLIAVTVNSLSNPIERLRLGEDGRNTNEICALLSVIISRNKNNN